MSTKTAGHTACLTTHVLDTMNGTPAAGISLSLYRIGGTSRELVADRITNSDGRCDTPLLEGDQLVPDVYELWFDVGRYFAKVSPEHPASFYIAVPIRFSVPENPGHLHVPLLISPFGYSTYRGS